LSHRLPDIADLGHGIGVIPIPLPFRSPPWVNAYVIATSTSVTLIDCGVDWDVGMERLLEGLRALEVEPSAIDRLVVSHLHPDHVGMAPRVTDRCGAELVMHRTAARGYLAYNDRDGFEAWLTEFGTVHGVPSDALPVFGRLEQVDWMPAIGPPDVIVDDGDSIDLGDGRALEVMHTPGHEQSHICLVDSTTGILFSGDHVLPRITPLIAWTAAGTDVLGEYIASLHRIVERGFGRTYPAHGSIVDRGASRAEQISLHRERRLGGMLDVVALGPATAWHVMLHSFRPDLTIADQRFALRETVAHLEHLRVVGRVTSFDEVARWYRRT